MSLITAASIQHLTTDDRWLAQPLFFSQCRVIININHVVTAPFDQIGSTVIYTLYEFIRSTLNSFSLRRNKKRCVDRRKSSSRRSTWFIEHGKFGPWGTNMGAVMQQEDGSNTICCFCCQFVFFPEDVWNLLGPSELLMTDVISQWWGSIQRLRTLGPQN